jgi:S1-C subfamily serine protease
LHTSYVLRRSFLAACLVSSPTAWGQSLAGLVARSKGSVVAVGSFSALRSPRFSFSGTGFVLGDGTLVATCLHVLPDLVVSTERVELSVQLQSERGDLEWRAAKVLVRDRARDLCLLRLEGAPAPALSLTEHEAADSVEGTSVALMGYPLGGALGFSVVTHRGIISSRVSSTAPAPSAGTLSDRAVLSARSGAFDLLQLDATAYPGNSGGPLVNVDSGAVIGVVSMVLVKGTRESALSSPTGITYAVPAKYVAAMLKQI